MKRLIISLMLYVISYGAQNQDIVIEIDKLENSSTPLMKSILAEDDIETVKRILEQDRNINAQDSQGRTALYIAAQNGLDNIVKLLLSHGQIDTNLSDNNGLTPLSIAIENNSYKCIDLLSQAKDLNINKQDDKGYFPLARAVMKNDGLLVKLLIANKANPLTGTVDCNIDLNYLMERFNTDKNIRALIEDTTRNCLTNTKQFIENCKIGNFSEALKLLDNPINLRSLSDKNIFALILIDLAIFKKIYSLLNLEPNKLLRDLIFNYKNLPSECIKFVLSHNSDINQVNSGQSLLHTAVSQNNLEAVRILIRNSANLKLRNNENRIPLQEAVFRNSNNAIQKILRESTSCRCCYVDSINYECTNLGQCCCWSKNRSDGRTTIYLGKDGWQALFCTLFCCVILPLGIVGIIIIS